MTGHGSGVTPLAALRHADASPDEQEAGEREGSPVRAEVQGSSRRRRGGRAWWPGGCGAQPTRTPQPARRSPTATPRVTMVV